MFGEHQQRLRQPQPMHHRAAGPHAAGGEGPTARPVLARAGQRLAEARVAQQGNDACGFGCDAAGRLDGGLRHLPRQQQAAGRAGGRQQRIAGLRFTAAAAHHDGVAAAQLEQPRGLLDDRDAHAGAGFEAKLTSPIAEVQRPRGQVAVRSVLAQPAPEFIVVDAFHGPLSVA